MSAKSAPPVAMALASNATAALPAARRSAMMPEPTTAASSKPVPMASAAARRRMPRVMAMTSRSSRGAPDRVGLPLQRHAVERRDRQREEQLDPRVEEVKGLPEG